MEQNTTKLRSVEQLNDAYEQVFSTAGVGKVDPRYLNIQLGVLKGVGKINVELPLKYRSLIIKASAGNAPLGIPFLDGMMETVTPRK